jgi:hypothetical protein
LTSTVLRFWRLRGLRHRLGVRRARRIPFARRQRTVGGQFLDPAQVGLGALGLGAGVRQRGFVLGDGGGGAPLVLGEIGERCALGRQLGARLLQALGVDAVVDAHQELALLHVLEVLHVDLDDVAGQLRTDDGHLAAHHGVLGGLDRAAEGRQVPGVQHDQHADQRDEREQQAAGDDVAVGFLL